MMTLGRTMSDSSDIACVQCDGETVEARWHCSFRCVECDYVTYVGPSNHIIEDRWDARVDEDVLAEAVDYDIDSMDRYTLVQRIWEDARTLPVEETYFLAEEVRYSLPAQILILRRDATLVTVIDAVTARKNARQVILDTYREAGLPTDELDTLRATLRLDDSCAGQGEGTASGAHSCAPGRNAERGSATQSSASQTPGNPHSVSSTDSGCMGGEH